MNGSVAFQFLESTKNHCDLSQYVSLILGPSSDQELNDLINLFFDQINFFPHWKELPVTSTEVVPLVNMRDPFSLTNQTQIRRIYPAATPRTSLL